MSGRKVKHTTLGGGAAAEPTKALSDWLSLRGVRWNPRTLIFRASKLHGAGVFAGRNVKAGELLATIPKSACLCVKTSACRRKLDALLSSNTIDDDIALTLATLYEQRLGPRSRWAGYFRYLEQDVPHTPLFWTPQEQALLRGTECDRCDRAGWRCDAQQQRKAEAVTLLRGMATLLRRLMPGGKPVSLYDFMRAQYWCQSRAFLIDAKLGEGLVPLADMFNHKAAVVPCQPVVAGTPRTGRARAMDIAIKSSGVRDTKASVVAMSPLRRGCEIFNTYGHYGNAKLLADYGFVCADNPHDEVVVRPPDLARAAANLQKESLGTVRRRMQERLRPWRFRCAGPARREAEKEGDDVGDMSESDFSDDDLDGFRVGRAGGVQAPLRRVAAAMRRRPPRKGQEAAAAAPILRAALRDRRAALTRPSALCLKRPAGQGAGHRKARRTSGERVALAARLRQAEVQILDAVECRLP